MRRVLIANRGEIACRIIVSCHKLGLETVAVFSDADRGALHTTLATVAYHLGGSDPRDSYLNISKVLEVAVAAGADAIHPGYGFLSERPEFAEAVRAVGKIFIGPSPDAMRRLGDKIEAKKLAAEAGVPLVPGAFLADSVSALADAQAFVATTTLPILIKAAAGGGGRGMRALHRIEDLEPMLESAGREAESAFGNGTVFIEKLISPARHVEVQIVGDSLGNVVHFFDRDCSMQRNHQKVIEEAPAPEIPLETRETMYRSACSLAKLAGYSGAATVEFLVDAKHHPYFLEVNSRLQVEHPVTEAIAAVDLVELQLRVARGESLPEILAGHWILDTPIDADTIEALGSAIEVRICAETYEDGFLPATGLITEFSVDDSVRDLRVDSGIAAGSRVTHHYDSLLAKIVVSAGTRDEAIDNMCQTLAGTRLVGVRNNIALLLEALASEPFVAVTHTTGTLEKLLPTPEQRRQKLREVALEWLRLQYFSPSDPESPYADRSGFRLNGISSRRFYLEVEGEPVEILVSSKCGSYLATVKTSDTLENVSVLEQPNATTTSQDDFLCTTFGSFSVIELPVSLGRTSSGTTQTQNFVRAPLPGRVVKVSKQVGDHVEAGEAILVLESMKMEHPMRAPRAGKILKIHVNESSVVEARALLVELSDE